MPKVIIADSSAIICLGKNGYLHILKEMYGEIFIPEAVFLEVKEGTLKDTFDISKESDWIRVVVITNRKDVEDFPKTLHLGEREAIVLYKNLNADLIILDDLKARMEATKRGQNITGVIGVLIKAKESNIIPLVMPIINQIRKNGLYISDKLAEDICHLVNED